MKWLRKRVDILRDLEAAETERDWLRDQNARLISGMFEVNGWETQQIDS